MTLHPNQTLGKWTLLERLAGSKPLKTRTRWVCRCECGTKREVPEDRLKSGASRSCGCTRAAEHTQTISAALRPFGRNHRGDFR